MASGSQTKIKLAKESLAALVEQSPNPLLAFDASGHLLYVNRAAEEWAREASLPSVARALPEQTEALIAACLAGSQTRCVETTLGARTCSWFFFPSANDRLVYCSVTDVSERFAMEEQLRLSQRVDLTGRLATGLARDFANVVTVIQGQVGLLRADQSLNATMEESLRAVALAAERAAKLSRQLLDFSGDDSVQHAQIDLNDLLTRLSPLLGRCLGEDITFQFDYESDLPPLQGDATLIEQIVLNLAVNARHAMPRGGQLTLQTARVDIDQDYVDKNPDSRTGPFLCLTMTDTGRGMNESERSRLFEPFFTARRDGGNALGLAIVNRIVQQHGGWIEVRSQPDEGSTFKVYFPPCQRREEPSREIPEGHETVLVVEDESAVRLTVRHVLERCGYRVVEAANSVDALAVWHRHQDEIALLFTDLMLPNGLTGQDLAEKFKAMKPDLKVVYASGYSKETVGPDPITFEGGVYLEKPFDADTLGRVVRAAIDGVDNRTE